MWEERNETMADSTTRIIKISPELDVTLTEAGSGRPVLILHGGGGPFTVASIANYLSGSMHTILPTHPGWNGTPRPDSLDSITGLAKHYMQYLKDNQLTDVLVIGSSLGGWLGTEIAALDRDNIITGLILINAVGITVESEPIRDFFALSPREVAEYSFHDGNRFYVDPATLPPEQTAIRQQNMVTMRVYAGEPYMHNPALKDKLGQIKIPALVIWGDSDRIVTPAYGQTYAKAFKNARFEIVKDAGHLPQIEQPAATFKLIDAYVNNSAL